MDEVKLVAIGITEVERHRPGTPRNGQGHVVVAQERGGSGVRVPEVRRLQLVQIEAVRPQLAFEADPARRWVGMVEVSRLAVKSLAAVLFFVRALGQADV